jgi:hypothetical protein
MILRNDIELANTREKLAELEARYRARSLEKSANPRIQELTLRSLKRLINQLKEEIARYVAHQPARR